MNPRLLCAALLLVLAAAGLNPAQAQRITVLDVGNDISADSTFDSPDGASQFSGRLRVQPATVVDDTEVVDLRMTWMMAALHEPPPVAAAIGLVGTLGFSLTIEVNDPHNLGYTLAADTRMRGIAASGMDGVGNTSTTLPTFELALFEAFTSAPRLLPGASTATVTSSQPGPGLERLVVGHRGSEVVGRYVGTQQFLFFVQPVSPFATALSFVPNNDAYTWQQFGEISAAPRLGFANPLPTDPALEDLGYFLRISADFRAAPVPEPGPGVLLAVGLGALLLRRGATVRSGRRVLHRAAALAAAALALLAGSGVQAQGITVQDWGNDSEPDFVLSRAGVAAQFRTALDVSGPQTTGLTTTVDLHLSWILASFHQAPDDPGLGSQSPMAGWALALRVDDPLRQGYSLDVNTRLRGILGASTTNTSNVSNIVQPMTPSVYDVFSGPPRPLPGANTVAGAVFLDPDDTQGRLEINQVAADSVGRYIGTREFLFFAPASELRLLTLSLADGYTNGWQQFGHTTQNPQLAFANPAQTDPDLRDLGYFFRVSATFNAAPVPEPATWLSLGVGLAGLLWRRGSLERRP